MWRICEEARLLSAAERERFLREQRLDPDLERDVISLLMEPDESVTTSWGTPLPESSEGGGGGAAVLPARSLVGTQIGRYVISETIGRGGGGEVYAARDTDLDRMVAVKFLHPGRMERRWTVERFLREAKAASALNHPGIITVYEVIQSEAGLAIVMEMVEGRPLRMLCRAANPAPQVLHWGAQIAEALAAAHGRGIIHRDVKPENLMLRADGFVKVLDFGLAENLSGMEESITALLPAGTLRYMSPEQASGSRLTTATDVFSLGIVLYELTTGRHPYPATTPIATLQKIATGEPPEQPPSQLVRELPAEFEQMLLRMLDREPLRRPSAQEVAAALRRFSGLSAPQPRPKWWIKAAAAAGCCGLLALGTLAWREYTTSRPITVSPIPLTDSPGVDSHPDVSPDGESVVYGWGAQENSHTHLYVKRLDRDEAVKLLEADRGERVSNPRWSPDGTRVLFKSSAPGYKYALWTIARDGTDRRKILDLRATDHSSGLSWAAAAGGVQRIAYTDKSEADGNRYAVRVRNLATGEDRIVTHPPAGTWGDWDPRLSADGATIAFKRVTGLSNDQIYVMPATGGEAVEVTTGRRGIAGHAWLDDQRLLVAGKFASSVYGLWSLKARAAATPEPVHRSSMDGVMPSVRGHRAAWVNRLDDHNIYTVPVAGGTPVRRISSAMFDGKPAMSPDGRIAFVSRRSGDSELWIARPQGAEPVRVTNLKAEIWRPTWSRDGTRLAFSVQGDDMILTMSCPPEQTRCGAPERLTPGTNPMWAREAIYFVNAKDEIWRVTPGGGKPQFTQAFGRDPVVSADGKWLYYRQARDGLNLARVPLDSNGLRAGGEDVLVDRVKSANREQWAVAGDEVIYWDNDTDARFSGLRAFHTVTRRSRVVAEGPAMFPTVSPDGKTLLFSKRDRSGVNVMVADLSQ